MYYFSVFIIRCNMIKYFFGNIVFLFAVCLFFATNISAQTNTNMNPNGYNTFYYPNSNRVSSEGNMRDGKPDGYWKTYYPTGVPQSEGNRIGSLLDSIWVFYTNTGDTAEIINYRLGKKSGYYYKFETITERNRVSKHYLKSKELFLDDKREGQSFYYYPSGNIRQIINYKNGKKQGDSKEYDESGTVITLYEYNNDYMISREFINRFNDRGEKHGTWKTFYPGGQIKDEDYYKNGVLDGTSIVKSERGLTINQRVYRDGKIIEDGIQLKAELIHLVTYYEDGVTIMRKGSYLDSIPIGEHYFYNREGIPEKRINYNTSGIRVGEGAVDENENRIGDWKNFFETGELRSSGKFVNDRQNGEWIFYLQDGKKMQTGNFRNGVMEREWIWYYPSGNIFREEIYSGGRPNGLCVQYSDSMTIVAKGEYVEGEREGFWIENVGDAREEGNYTMGEKNGLWKTYYNDGRVSHAGNFIQGNPDGRHLFYYPDGTLKEEQYYVMGRRDRNWRKYYENGGLFLTVTYNNDEEVRINGIRVDSRSR